jgi:hypothetical protein
MSFYLVNTVQDIRWTVHSLLFRRMRITNYHQCDEHLPIAVDAYPSPCKSVHSQ